MNTSSTSVLLDKAPSVPASSISHLDKRFDAVAAALLVLIALIILIPPLWTPGIVNPSDFLMSVDRIFTLDESIQNGVYFPRFGAEYNFGYGAPLFEYYPPLASYIGLAFSTLGMGYIAAAKAVLSLALVLGGLGTYLYGRFLFRNQLAAFVSGVLFLASPYYMLVLYERGAVAEMVAWGLLPWLFWSMHRWFAWGRRWDGILAALIVAMLLLAHNATAMFIVPGAALFMVLLALLERKPANLVRVALAFALGAGISAFYWLPAILEVGYSHANEHMFSGASAIANNTVGWRNVMQHAFIAQYAGEERFRFALWMFAIGAISIVAMIAQRRRRPVALWLLAVAWIAIMLLQTNASLIFWDNVPYVRYIQFPWRLHGIGSFCVALLVGGALMDVWPRTLGRRVVWAAAVGGFACLALFLTMTNASPAKSMWWLDMEEESINQASMWERGQNGYPLWTDYIPQSVLIGSKGYTISRPLDHPTRLAATITPEMTVVRDNPVRTVVTVNAAEPWILRLHRVWFPGWRMTVDGEAVETSAAGGGGIVSAQLPAGQYEVVAWFGNSPLRLGATIASVLSLAILLAWAIRPQPLGQALLVALVLALLLGAGIQLATVELKPGVTPVPLRADFDNGISLLGYKVENQTICVDDAVQLRTWWHVAQTPATDFKFFSHVITPDDTARVAQSDVFPSDGYVPMTRWESGELVPQTQLVTIDAGTSPGSYSLLIGMYDPVTMTNARVLNAPRVLPGDRLVLTDIVIADCSQ